MCLIVLSWLQHAEFPLVFAANRDEFYARPTQPAHFWDDAPQVLAGRDLEAGGTWCGISRSGRFAAVTNVREPERESPPAAKSRGHLVSHYLTGEDSPESYLERTMDSADEYAGFNLLVGGPGALHFYSNRSEEGARALGPGLYGLSNGDLDTPWPKVERAKRVLKSRLVEAPSAKPYFELLADDTRALDEQLPNTGVGREWERRLSPIFIRSEAYGTRASTVLWIDRNDRVTFVERSYPGSGASPSTVEFTFDIESET